MQVFIIILVTSIFNFFSKRNYERHTVNTDMQSDQAAKENILYFDQKRLKTTFLGDKRS